MGTRRYLVTGGAGFIGSHIVEALLRRGDDLVILDNFTTGRRENIDAALRSLPRGAPAPRVIEGDIRDPAVVADAMRGTTHVLHQAALPSVPRSVAAPLESHDVNATGTLNLLVAARDAEVARFVYASSSSVYGDSEQLPKVETMTPAPRSPYAVNKLTGELYCRIFNDLYAMETIALRYFNIFGPRQDPNSQYAAVVPRFITAATSGMRPTIFGDGLQSRDFTYIDNAVQANLLACEAPAGACGAVYNVACGSRATLLDLIAILENVLGTPIRPVHEPPRPGDVKHSLASIDAAGEWINYTPEIGIEEGVRKTVTWFRA